MKENKGKKLDPMIIFLGYRSMQLEVGNELSVHWIKWADLFKKDQ